MKRQTIWVAVVGLAIVVSANAQTIRQDQLGDNKLTCDQIVSQVREMEAISARAQQVSTNQQNQYGNNQGDGLIQSV